MLYHLLFPLHEQFAVFNVFRYITFRAAGAVLTAVGEMALRRARALLDEASDIERMATTLAAGVEALAYRARAGRNGITVTGRIPFLA